MTTKNDGHDAEVHKGLGGEIFFETNGAVGKKLYGKHGCEYVRLTIQPGATIAPHSVNIPVTFIVLNGAAHFTFEDKRYEVEKGGMIEVDAGVERACVNEGPDELSLLVVRYV